MSNLISKQAILKHIENIRQSAQMMDDIQEASIIMFGMYLCEEAVRNQPYAQTERKKGHWVEIASSNHTYKCSVCGRLLVNITDGKNNVAKNYPYCHCGADMRQREE